MHTRRPRSQPAADVSRRARRAQRQPRGRAAGRVAADGEPRACAGCACSTATRCSCARRAAWRRPPRPTASPRRCGTRCTMLDVAIQRDGERYDPAASGAHVPPAHERHRRDDLPAAADASAGGAGAAACASRRSSSTTRTSLPALESGRIDLAFGYIPGAAGRRAAALLHERYVVLMRAGHPLAAAPADARGARAAPLRAGPLAPAHRPRAEGPRPAPTTSASRCRISWCCRASSPRPISRS